MRQLIASIDGDGCGVNPWLEKTLFLIRKHPSVKFTVGVIVCYFDGSNRPEDREERIDVMKSILAETNVEPACHSYSHPMSWAVQEPQNLVKPGLPLVLSKEVRYATDFIEENLTSKKVRVYQLTGDCNPSGPQLRAIYNRGLYPFNGGVDGKAPFFLVNGDRQYSQRAPPDCGYTGIRQHRTVDGKQEAYVANPEGYKQVLDYFAEHPERPVHCYSHIYAGEFRPTFGSVDYVLCEVEKMHLEPLFVSEYISRLPGAAAPPRP